MGWTRLQVGEGMEAVGTRVGIGAAGEDAASQPGQDSSGCGGVAHHEGGRDHDLQPAGSRDRLERGEAVGRDVGELDAAVERIAADVARPADAGVDQDDVDEACAG